MNRSQRIALQFSTLVLAAAACGRCVPTFGRDTDFPQYGVSPRVLERQSQEELARAELHFLRGSLKDAELDFKRATVTWTEAAPEGLLGLTKIALARDDTVEARRWAIALEQHFPYSRERRLVKKLTGASPTEAHGRRGRIPQRASSPEEAWSLAVDASRRRDHAEANALLYTLTKTWPRSALASQAHLARARNFDAMRQPILAELEYRRALQICKRDAASFEKVSLILTSRHLQARPDLAVFYCKELSMKFPDAQERCLPYLARALRAWGKPDEAYALWQKVRTISTKQQSDFLALDEMASIDLEERNRPNQAMEKWEQIIDRYGPERSKSIEHPQWAQFLKLRSQLDDVGPAVIPRFTRLSTFLKSADAATNARLVEYVVTRYPESPEVRPYAVRAAVNAFEDGDFAQAASFSVLALDNAGDRTNLKSGAAFPPPNPPAPANTRHLRQISTPLESENIAKAITVLLKSYDSLLPERHAELPEDSLQAAIAEWTRCVDLSYRFREPRSQASDKDDWLHAWLSLARQVPLTALEPLAYLAAGQRLRHSGHFWQAKSLLQRTVNEFSHFGPIAARAHLELGRLYAESWGNFAPAAGHLKRSAELGDPIVAGIAKYALAEGYEATGEFHSAQTIYRDLAQNAKNHRVRAGAQSSISRLDALGSRATTSPKPKSPTTPPLAIYIGEDRQSQGDWRNHGGRAAFLACAKLSAGSLQKPRDRFRVYTGHWQNPLPPFSWVTAGADRDPSSVFDVVQRAGTFSNWDDGGERRDLGEGSISVRAELPDGIWRLSLYFVNEYNYYEPSRQYTISISSDSGTFLCGTSVRDFVNGVYKQFLVRGPQVFHVTVWRNLSLNTLLGAILLDPLQLRDSPQPLQQLQLSLERKASLGKACLPTTLEIVKATSITAPLDRQVIQRIMDYLQSAPLSLVDPEDLVSQQQLSALDIGYCWRLSRLFNNEPDTVRGLAVKFFQTVREANLGPDISLEDVQDLTDTAISKQHIALARDYAYASMVVFAGSSPLFGTKLLDYLDKFIRLAPIYTDKYGNSRNYSIDLSFVRWAVRRQLQTLAVVHPDFPPPQLDEFLSHQLSTYLFPSMSSLSLRDAMSASGTPRTQYYGRLAALSAYGEFALDAWPDYLVPEGALRIFVMDGRGIEMSRRLDRYLSYYESHGNARFLVHFVHSHLCGHSLYSQAREVERTALGLYSDDSAFCTSLILRLARQLCAQGQFEQAERECRRALALFPQQGERCWDLIEEIADRPSALREERKR